MNSSNEPAKIMFFSYQSIPNGKFLILPGCTGFLITRRATASATKPVQVSSPDSYKKASGISRISDELI